MVHLIKHLKGIAKICYNSGEEAQAYLLGPFHNEKEIDYDSAPFSYNYQLQYLEGIDATKLKKKKNGPEECPGK